MDVLLIPGFWLDGSSWDEVAPALIAAGHRVRALTLPGLESACADRSGLTLRHHVDAVVREIDALDGAPVALVGHSGGSAVAHGAVDARPDRVARAVHVDAVPLPPGASINDALPVVDGEVPLPEWGYFDDADLVDLDDELRAAFRARAVPIPARVANDPQELSDERRFAVPATVVCCEFPAATVAEWRAEGHPVTAELARIADVEYVDLPTGHWPQFTRPRELGAALVAALDRTAGP